VFLISTLAPCPVAGCPSADPQCVRCEQFLEPEEIAQYLCPSGCGSRAYRLGCQRHSQQPPFDSGWLRSREAQLKSVRRALREGRATEEQVDWCSNSHPGR